MNEIKKPDLSLLLFYERSKVMILLKNTDQTGINIANL